jgi:hypothetical protein
MSRQRWTVPLAVVAVLATVTLACGGGSGTGGSGGTGNNTAVPASSVIFQDSFQNSRGSWSSFTDETGAVNVRNGAYEMEVFEPNWHIWGTPEQDISNAKIKVNVTSLGDASDPGFGVICNYQSNDAFYYAGFGPDGFYAIVYWDGEDDVSLLGGERLWQQSDEIEQFAESYELEVECADDGTITLFVDGVEIASANDSTYTSGNIGLFAVSFDNVPVKVRFDDLVVTELE